MKRILEPELMEDEVQVLAYARADFADSNSNFVRHFTELAGRDFAGARPRPGVRPGGHPATLGAGLPAHDRARARRLGPDVAACAGSSRVGTRGGRARGVGAGPRTWRRTAPRTL